MHHGTERLMPWRTLLEVAKTINRKQGWEAVVVSSSNIYVETKREYQSIEIIEIPKGKTSFNRFFTENIFDVIYYPISWRDGLKSMSFLSNISYTKIAYITGGIYNFKGVMSLMRTVGWAVSKSYVLELITPKWLITNKLIRNGFERIIVFSDYTALYAVKSGWDIGQVVVALPGKDNFDQLIANKDLLAQNNLVGKKFYLFMGAPAEARGSIQLLEAFDLFARKNPNALLVFLLRTDNHSNFSSFFETYDELESKNQILILRDKLLPSDLKSYVESARAVILPFLIIPSEIPLTYFEVLSCGVPIITFKNGGTYDYLKSCLLACSPGSIKGLSKLMNEMWSNDIIHDKLSKSSLELMENHPDWESSSLEWIKTI